MTVVVDTNVVAALMLRTEQNPVVADCFVRDCDWHLPVLWRSEFRHVLLNCRLLTFDRKLLQLFPDVALKPGS